ncbi:MAG: lytic murein transglycosylase [Hyphomicrobiales bacterium]|nr:lytic murein transglycosylase [Hyphomicrobiales bacterium]
MRIILLVIGLILAVAPAAFAQPADMEAFLRAAWPAAQAAGVSRATFETATLGLEPEPGLLTRAHKQGEFSLAMHDYIAQSATAGRVSAARGKEAALASQFAAAERSYGVPRSIILALWAMESNFGADQGRSDVLRVLATLAIKQHRPELFRDEFVAALVMLQKGMARRDQLVGSWAGAMGQPQFMPSSYLKFARSFSDGAPDIWRSPPDVIASIANFMHESGWTRGLPPAMEVTVPDNFDWKPLDLDLAQWRALGFRRANGAALPASGKASLYFPEGAQGPAFLLTDNWEVIRQYNTSDAYALAVSLLAARIEGDGLRKGWPKVAPLSLSQRAAAQRALAAQGFYAGVSDGKVGRATRVAVHAWQLAHGARPADGFLTPALIAALTQ